MAPKTFPLTIPPAADEAPGCLERASFMTRETTPMTTNATNAPIWLGGAVLLLWALLARTAWAQGAQARIVVAPDYTRAGVEVACGEFDHRYSWPVSRHIYIYNELTRGSSNGTGLLGTFHDASRECDGAIVGTGSVEDDHVGRVLTAWRGARACGARQIVSTGGADVKSEGGDSANARDSVRQDMESDETAPPPDSTLKAEDFLIVQLTVSHSRNYDQISLVFREDVVDLVTNTSTYQEEPVRLGWLRNPMSEYFTVMRDRIEIYHAMLRDEVSVLELLLNDPDLAPYAHLLKPEIVPHAPVLTINGEEVAHDHPYFDGLVTIFDEVWKKEWSCVDCVTYRAIGDRILRIRTGEGKERSEIAVPRTVFDCFPVGDGGSRIECVDPEFGIFEISSGDEN